MNQNRRTDNRYLPNTKEGNDKFCWWLHWFSGENQFVILMYLINLEKQYKRENNSSKPLSPHGVN